MLVQDEVALAGTVEISLNAIFNLPSGDPLQATGNQGTGQTFG